MTDRTHREATAAARSVGVEAIRLPDAFYFPPGSGRPLPGAIAYVRGEGEDGERRYGVLYEAREAGDAPFVDWWGDRLSALGQGARIIEGEAS